jgi:hypothetical protein
MIPKDIIWKVNTVVLGVIILDLQKFQSRMAITWDKPSPPALQVLAWLPCFDDVQAAATQAMLMKTLAHLFLMKNIRMNLPITMVVVVSAKSFFRLAH